MTNIPGDRDLTKVPTALAGVYELLPKVRSRGKKYVMELLDADDLAKCLGLPITIKRILRSPLGPWDAKGIHVPPVATGLHKIGYAAAGEVDQYVVDFRPDSPTFGNHIKMRLTGFNAAWIAAGCGNLIQGRENGADYMYGMMARWEPGIEVDVNMFCPYLNIRLDHEPLNLSDRDINAPDTSALFGTTNAFGAMIRRKKSAH
jgi:dTDP-4-dehydrorhamnose 3,5-epimerase